MLEDLLGPRVKTIEDVNIVSPAIYNQEEYHDYGVHKLTGEIYSKKSGSWKIMRLNVSGTCPYPKGSFSVKDKNGNTYPKSVLQHVLVHETLNPELPVPPGVKDSDWEITPKDVKKIVRHIWQVNHIDHDHENYSPENLEWVTGQQNVDKYQKYRNAQ